jgi:hypothetical protein
MESAENFCDGTVWQWCLTTCLFASSYTLPATQNPTLRYFSTQLESIPSRANNSSLHLRRAKKRVTVRNTHKSSPRRLISSAIQDQIPRNSISNLLRVNRQHSPLNVLEHCALHKRLSAHASVNSRRTGIKHRVENVRSAEAKQRLAAVDVLPVIISVSDVQFAFVLGAVAIAVAHKGGLEMVVEVRVADGQVIRAMAEIRQTIVVVFARSLIRAQVQVVEPNVCGGLHADCVAAGVAGADFADGYVADYDVFGVADEEAEACEAGRGVEAEDRFVASDADFLGAGDFAFDVDGGGGCVFVVDRGEEFGVGADGDCFASSSAGLWDTSQFDHLFEGLEALDGESSCLRVVSDILCDC